MRVSYTPAPRETAIATYQRLGSYAQTQRALGYPSRHVLHDWVREGPPSTHPRPPTRPPRHYSWEFKARAVERVLAGEAVKWRIGVSGSGSPRIGKHDSGDREALREHTPAAGVTVIPSSPQRGGPAR